MDTAFDTSDNGSAYYAGDAAKFVARLVAKATERDDCTGGTLYIDRANAAIARMAQDETIHPAARRVYALSVGVNQ